MRGEGWYAATVLLGRGVLRALDVERTWHGLEHLPTDGPVLLACNHVSFPDFAFVGEAGISVGRRIRFLCRHDLWDVPVVGRAMRSMRHVPVDRAAPAAAYLTARRLLLEGEPICAFPEAGVSHSYTVRALMPGVASLARETGVPVVPVAVWGQQRLWPLRRSPQERARPALHRGARVDVAFGEPFGVGPGADLVEVTADLGSRMTGLLEGLQGLPHHVPRPGERARWYPAHLGGTAPTRIDAEPLDLLPRTAVAPTWGPSVSPGAVRRGAGSRDAGSDR